MRRYPLLLASALLTLPFTAALFSPLAAAAKTASSPTSQPARVYAAASLTQALTAAATAWRLQGRPAPVLVFGSSGALAKQLEAGAPADLFVAADSAWMDHLEQHQRLLPGSRHNLLGNTLVMVAPKDQIFSVKIRSDFKIADQFNGRWCTGEPGAVPAGTYAREALQKLGWWSTLSGRLVGAENVRSALAFVARGECAMGIVYGTDARSTAAVAILGTFPASLHSPIVYPIAALRGASTEGLAFLNYLQSNAGLLHFRQAGFEIVPR